MCDSGEREVQLILASLKLNDLIASEFVFCVCVDVTAADSIPQAKIKGICKSVIFRPSYITALLSMN